MTVLGFVSEFWTLLRPLGLVCPRWLIDPPASAVGGLTCHKANVSKIGVPPTHTAPQLLMEDDLGEKYC